MTAIRLRSRAVSRCILSLAVVAGCGSGGSNPKPGPDQGGAAGSMMMAGGSGGGSAPMGGSGGSGGRGGMGGGAGGAGGGMAMGGSGGSGPAAGLNVLTQKYDNARTGWNAAEKMLTLANVNVMTFGKLFSQKVDGQIYAQPLYVSGVNIGGKPHNVVYVVTMHNTLYAFDADAKADPLFMLSVGPSAPKGPLCGCNDIAPEVGATATPVIDLASKTIYFTSKHAVGAAWEYHLNAIDIVSGMPKTGSPVKITGMVAGTGGGSSGGMLAFDAKLHHNRPGLLLQGGRIYIGFASHGDGGNYHGWVFAYDAATLDQKGQFNTSPNAQGAGIWSSGIGLVGDGENVYFSTGNGKTNPDPMNLTLGEALVKLDKDLKLVDWHIRGDYAKLDGGDTDYGMGGPLLMSKPGLLIAGGKDAWALVYDKTNLGKYKMDDVMAVLQKFKGGGGNTFNGMHSGSFIWWDQAQTVYGWPGNSKLLGFKLNGMKFDEMPAVVGPTVSPGIWSYGCMVGSSNADKDGIIWALTPVQDNPNQKIVAGKLRAFDAAKGALLWDSTTMKDRDDVGLYASYSYPTVANGKVYAPSWNGSTSTTPGGELEVYGLIK